MRPLPESVATFLEGKRFVVAGVSHKEQLPANLILKKLRASGFEAVPVNPNAATVDGETCYPDVRSVPGEIDGVIIAAHPDVALQIVRDTAARGVKQIWFHRSFGNGSVSEEAVAECSKSGINPIVGGCPLMYCGDVDIAHRCFRWFLGLSGKVPR